jgi:hypothetical protein
MPTRRRRHDSLCYRCRELRSEHNLLVSDYYGEALVCPGALEDNTFKSLDEVEAQTIAEAQAGAR